MKIKYRILRNLEILGESIKKLNQIVLVFPVWMTLGLSGFFRSETSKEGWTESKKNTKWGNMY